MHFVVHVGTARGAGSGLVCRSVLQHLPQVGHQHRFTFWAPYEWREREDMADVFARDNVEVRWTHPGPHQKFIDENVRLRRFLHQARPDALFSAVDTSLPACPVPHLLMVQQSYLAYVPNELGFRLSLRLRAKMEVMALYLRLALPTVSRITVQTEDMKVRVARRYGIAQERIDVIPSSVQPAVDAATRIGGRPFLAYVATASPHKNHEVLASMMHALRHHDLVCRLTVRPHEVPRLVEQAERLDVMDRFVFEGRVPPQRAIGLMASAQAVLMPTWIESFGIPFYEAMAVGSPIVASDRAFAREACGEAAEYAKPDSGASFAAAVERVLAGDRAAYARAGQARLDKVQASWQEIAARYLAVLEHISGDTIR